MEVQGVKIRNALVVLVLLAAGFGVLGSTAGQVTAQDTGAVPAAALVEGDCGSPGDSVADLNELKIRDEGDVLTSFTTVDLAIDEIADGHAVVLTDGGDVIACGDSMGTGNDLYVAVNSTSDAGWGGIAWLHARNSGTQITLFVAQGLGGSGAAPVTPTEEPLVPPGDDDETPVPPGDDEETPTPSARATSTPGSNAEGDTYTSPSYGYSLTYDPAVWEKSKDESNPTDFGPLDVLGLQSRSALVTLVGETGDEQFDATQLCTVRQAQYSDDPQVSNLNITQDVEGDANHAMTQFDYTFTSDNGRAFDWTVWIDCYNAPDNSVLLTFFYSAVKDAADQEAQNRETLLSGLDFPGQ